VAEDSVEEAEGKPEPLHALRMLNLQVLSLSDYASLLLFI
jgi:hypothetical protein